MTPLLAILAGVMAALAAYCYGMWQGEIGRRKAAESMVVHGTPMLEPSVKRVALPVSEDIAARQGKPFSDEAVKRGIQAHMAEMKAAGFELTEAEARMQVEGMLWQAAGGTPEVDEQAGIFGH